MRGFTGVILLLFLIELLDQTGEYYIHMEKNVYSNNGKVGANLIFASGPALIHMLGYEYVQATIKHFGDNLVYK